MLKRDMLSARSLMGKLYEIGSGNISPDIQKAVAWYRESFETTDDITSHVGLARIYAFPEVWAPLQPDGRCDLREELDPDYVLAHYHLDVLVSSAYVPAYWVKGVVFWERRGVAQSDREARIWFEKGATMGNFMAKLLLSQLNQSRSINSRLRFLFLKARFRFLKLFRLNHSDLFF